MIPNTSPNSVLSIDSFGMHMDSAKNTKSRCTVLRLNRTIIIVWTQTSTTIKTIVIAIQIVCEIMMTDLFFKTNVKTL